MTRNDTTAEGDHAAGDGTTANSDTEETSDGAGRPTLAEQIADPASAPGFSARRDADTRRGALQGPPPEERDPPAGERTDDGRRLSETAGDAPRRRVLSAVVDHEPGVLSAVAGLFSRREFNIESLTVGPTADERYARLTVVVEEPPAGIEQARKQLANERTVHLVQTLPTDAITRELALIKVDCDTPDEVRALAEMYDGEVVDACPRSATVQVTGSERTVDDAITAFGRFSVREVSRTGTTALGRSETTAWEAADHGTLPADFEPTLTETHAEAESPDDTYDGRHRPPDSAPDAGSEGPQGDETRGTHRATDDD